MTKPDPAVEVPVGTNTVTKPGTCTEDGLMVLTLTPELDLTAALLGTALRLAVTAALLAATTVNAGAT